MRFLNRLSFTATVAVTALIIAAPVSAQTNIVSNLDGFAGGGAGISSETFTAQSFTMGATAVSLQSITLNLEGAKNSATVFTSLYSNLGGLPGTSLATTTPQFIGSNGNFTYTLAVPQLLAANTTYWIVAGTTSGGTGWFVNANSSATSDFGVVLGSFYAVSGDSGASWSPNTAFPNDILRLRLEASAAAPEPGTLALVLLPLLGIVACRKRNAA